MSNENISPLQNVPPSLSKHSKNNSTSTLSSNYSHEINIEDDIPLLLTSPKPIHKNNLNKITSNQIYNNNFSNHSKIHIVTHIRTNSSSTEDKSIKGSQCRIIWNWFVDSNHPKRRFSFVALMVLIIALSTRKLKRNVMSSFI